MLVVLDKRYSQIHSAKLTHMRHYTHSRHALPQHQIRFILLCNLSYYSHPKLTFCSTHFDKRQRARDKRRKLDQILYSQTATITVLMSEFAYQICTNICEFASSLSRNAQKICISSCLFNRNSINVQTLNRVVLVVALTPAD